jgi:hypothetical protein
VRVNVYLPDVLAATVAERLPDLNVSAVLQRALAALLECRHDALSCAECATPVDRRELIDVELGRFYSDLMWELQTLVARCGTAEGAARIAKDLGGRYRVTLASRIPLPRPTHAERVAAKVSELPTEPERAAARAESRAHHPTAHAVTDTRRASA